MVLIILHIASMLSKFSGMISSLEKEIWKECSNSEIKLIMSKLSNIPFLMKSTLLLKLTSGLISDNILIILLFKLFNIG